MKKAKKVKKSWWRKPKVESAPPVKSAPIRPPLNLTIPNGTKVKILKTDFYGSANRVGQYDGLAPDGHHAVKVVVPIGKNSVPEEVTVAAEVIELATG